MIVTKRANAENLFKYYGKTAPYTLSGVVYFEDSGEEPQPVAVAGVYRLNGYKMIFSDIRPEGRKYRKTILKQAKEYISSLEYTVHAIVDENEPTSEKFLKHLGFQPVVNKPWVYVREVR